MVFTRNTEVFIKPGPGEQVCLTIPLPRSDQSVISGTVTDEGRPVPGALVVLSDQETDEALGCTVTDPLGRFWLGPVSADRLCRLRAQLTGGQVRIVELEG